MPKTVTTSVWPAPTSVTRLMELPGLPYGGEPFEVMVSQVRRDKKATSAM